MGASDVVKLSAGADSVRPAGGMQQVAQLMGGPGAQGMRPLPEAVQHKGGPGAQVMEPLTEAERMHMIWLGQQKQQKQLQAHQQEGEPLAEGMILVDKEEQAKENYDQTICDDADGDTHPAPPDVPPTQGPPHASPPREHESASPPRPWLQSSTPLIRSSPPGPPRGSRPPLSQFSHLLQSSQQVPNLHAVPHAPQSAIPGLPKMFMQMPTYNKVGQVPSRRQQLGAGEMQQQEVHEKETDYRCHRQRAAWRVCEELSEKGKEMEKLKLKQSEDLERYIRLDQYLEEVRR
eukprot:gene22520-29641_t